LSSQRCHHGRENRQIPGESMKGRMGWSLAFLAGFVLLWQALVLFGGISPWMLPGPLAVVTALAEKFPPNRTAHPADGI
ncbi:MAG TPA: hypothetical protein VHS59_02315, partial [Bacillota bacterium]|nr:hypothetical protein [Bacillota bacterium]